MKFNRNKWWGRHERFCRQVRVLYGRVREFSQPHVSTILGHVKVLYGRTQKCSPPFILAIPGQIKALYEKAQRSENTILDGINIFVPLFLTALIVLGCIIFAPWHVFSAANVRNWIFLLAGVWGVYGIIIAGRRTAEFAKQVRIQEQGQVAERLAKAAEQLSSKVMAVRILAIVSLRKIALGADMIMCGDIIEVLRTYAYEKNKSPMQEDTRKAIIVLGHINKNMKWDILVDLSNINLSGAKLRYVNLSGVDLQYANLSGVDLQCANLSGAILLNANLSGADLSGVDLLGANLWGADLSGADLSGVDLSGTDLSGANLSGVDLLGANLSGADLWSANLSDADLSGADLSGVSLLEVKGLDTAKNLEAVKNPPPEILDEIERRKQGGQK